MQNSNSTLFEYINLDYLNSLIGDDLETKSTMLSMLLDEIPEEIQKINDAHQANDIPTLKNAAHKLKSTLAFIANDQMTTANKAIEQIAKNNEGLEKLPELITVMNELQPFVLKDVKAAIEEMQ